MKNRITKSVPFLVSTAGKAIGGLTLYAAEVQPKYVTAARINTQLTTLLDADTQYQEAKVQLKEVRATLYALTATVRQFVYVARDAVKPHLGNRYSTNWQAFGLNGSIEVPRAVDELLPLLCSIDAYFTAHAAQQNPLLQATAQRAADLYNALRDAVNAVNHQLDEVSQLYGQRDTAAAALQGTLRLLLKELGIVFDPLDPRWISFGFKQPGAKQTPDQPEKVSVTVVDEQTAALKWEPAPRAESYRVRVRDAGDTSEPVLVGSPKDPDFTLEELPRDRDLEVFLSAVNKGGESRPTRIVVTIGSSRAVAGVGFSTFSVEKEALIE